MCPKTDDLNSFLFFKDLINQTVLNIDPSGIKPLKITDRLARQARFL